MPRAWTSRACDATTACRYACYSSGLFLGWFGPRGLASILFVLLILEESEVPHREELLAITVVTVALSALLHGVTAAPLARRYAQRVARMGECEEIRPVAEIPLREGPADIGSAS